MHHSNNVRKSGLLFNHFARFLLAGALLAFINACATANGPVISPLPAVDPATVATITLRSKPNFSDTKHRHFLYINGLAVAKFKEDDVEAFQIAEGKHTLKLTCHSRNNQGSGDFPFNFNVVDGDTEMDLEVLAGDSICLRIGFGPLKCAQLKETEPSYCEK